MANPYKQVANQTATPADLWMRGYRQVRGQLLLAKQAMECGDNVQRGQLLVKALEIIMFWTASLNAGEPDSELGKRLRTAYDFVTWQITKANVFKQKEGIDEALVMLDHLRDVFTKAI